MPKWRCLRVRTGGIGERIFKCQCLFGGWMFSVCKSRTAWRFFDQKVFDCVIRFIVLINRYWIWTNISPCKLIASKSCMNRGMFMSWFFEQQCCCAEVAVKQCWVIHVCIILQYSHIANILCCQTCLASLHIKYDSRLVLVCSSCFSTFSPKNTWVHSLWDTFCIGSSKIETLARRRGLSWCGMPQMSLFGKCTGPKYKAKPGWSDIPTNSPTFDIQITSWCYTNPSVWFAEINGSDFFNRAKKGNPFRGLKDLIEIIW